MGALLLTKLTKLVEKSLSLEVNRIRLWTDNKIVFDSLVAHPNHWPKIVRKTSEIIDLYNRQYWRHVGSPDIRIDCSFRDISAVEVSNEEL